MRKKLVLWGASIALFFGIFIYTNNADVHNEANVTPYSSYVTKDELSKLKEQTKAFYQNEYSGQVEEPVVVADTNSGYVLNSQYTPGTIIIFKTRMPYDEKLVYRYVTYVKENSKDTWTRLDEYQNTNCNKYDC
ncbi:MAG: hypothetical protein Q4G58_17995 [bacterium]|nr:hypothetical protein [bacterium]